MSMTITLKPETELLVQQELDSGHFGDVDELILRGVQAWREMCGVSRNLEQRRDAVARMLEFAEKNRTPLEDVSVKDLIHEGHRL